MKIDLKTQVDIWELDLPTNYNSEKGRKLLKSQAEKALTENILRVVRKVQQNYGADIFGFGNQVYHQRPNLWKKIKPNWKQLFKQLKVDVKAEIEIQGSGMAIKPLMAGGMIVPKELITERQGLAMMVLFIIGSTLVVGVSDAAKQDNWLSVILAMIMALPILMLYARLIHLFPGKDLYTIIHQVLGPIAGKAISLLFVWYAFHVGALVIRNFSEFLSEIALTETPQYFIQLVFVLLCIWAVKGGIEVLGRWTSFVFNILLVVIIGLILMSLTKINFANFTPILDKGFRPVIDGAFSVFSFPLAETVVFISILSFLKPGASGYKVYNLSLLIGGCIVLVSRFQKYCGFGFPISVNPIFPFLYNSKFN